jgi:hypothetical protein
VRVAGAPLSLRALAWNLCGGSCLATEPLVPESQGVVRARGRVLLDGPLFAPLSGLPCAGFELYVRGSGSAVGGVVRDLRQFRLEGEVTTALVSPMNADWHLPETARRIVAVDERLPERLSTLLDTRAEIRWLRERGVALELVERALCAGAEVSVLAVAQTQVSESYQVEEELAATGTDGGFSAPRLVPGPEAEGPQLKLVTNGELERAHVFADPADARYEGPSTWQVLLLFLGPALSFAGLLTQVIPEQFLRGGYDAALLTAARARSASAPGRSWRVPVA